MSQLILILLTLTLGSPENVDGNGDVPPGHTDPRHAAGLIPTDPKTPETPAKTQEEPAKAEPEAESSTEKPQEGKPQEEKKDEAKPAEPKDQGKETEAKPVAPAPGGEAAPEATPPATTAEEASSDTTSFYEKWKRAGKFRGRLGFRYDYTRLETKQFETYPKDVNRDDVFRTYLETETHGLGHEKLHSYVHLEWLSDLNGNDRPTFTNKLVNTYDNDSKFWLWSAWVEARDLGDRVDVRAGRIQTYEVHPVTFDGVWVQADKFELFTMPTEVRAFAGSMAVLYTNLDRRFVTGGGLLLQPHATVDVEFRDTCYDKNRLECEARWRPTRGLALRGMYSFIDSRSRDARVEGTFKLADYGFTLAGGYWQLFNHDFRLDYLTGQDSRELTDRYLLLTQMAPFYELYLRFNQDLQEWLSLGGEGRIHRLRDTGDESIYNSDYHELSGYVDLKYDRASLRTEVRYFHAPRDAVAIIQPRFPQPAVLTQAKVGETNHVEVALRGGVGFYRPGWGLDGGMVWHTVNYDDVYQSVSREEYVDYMVQVRARFAERINFLVRYQITRDMTYFVPYFDGMQTLTCMLDIDL